MPTIRSIASRNPIRRVASALLIASAIVATHALALERVVVIGDGRWRDCDASGGTPYGDSAGNYGGCHYGDIGGGQSPIVPPPQPGEGGGGSGSAPLEFVERDISPKLKCALDKYLHPAVRLGTTRTMRRLDAWAFVLQVDVNSWVYNLRPFNTSPGPRWKPAGGSAVPGTSYGRLYNRAFQENTGFSRFGVRSGAPDNSLSGTLTAFETSLYVAGHEASHLNGDASHLNGDEESQAEADWYGINAVLNYRADNGAQCAQQSN